MPSKLTDEQIAKMDKLLGLESSVKGKPRAKKKSKVKAKKEKLEKVEVKEEPAPPVKSRDDAELDLAISQLGEKKDDQAFMQAKLELLNCDPIVNIAQIANYGSSESLRLKANEVLLKKIISDKKQIDTNVKGDVTFNIQIAGTYQNGKAVDDGKVIDV